MEDVSMNAGTSTPGDFGSFFDSAMSADSVDTAAESDASEMEQSGDLTASDESTEGADVEAESAETDNGEVEEPEAAAEAEEQAEQPVSEASDDYIVREKNGKQVWEFKASRGQTIYNAYKAAQEAESLIGEPLTREAVEARQNAYADQQSIIADFLSGDASAEANVLEYFAQIAESAQKNGEVGHDPLVNLAERFAQFASRSDKAYAALSAPILKSQLSHLKQIARDRVTANKDDNDLALSIEHIEKALFGQHEPRDKFLVAPDPIDARLRDIEQREARLKQVETSRREQEWKDFTQQTNTAIRDTLAGAVDAALKDVTDAYRDFPEDFRAVKDLIRRDFIERTGKDAAWQSNLKSLTRKAQIAATPSARDAVKTELLKAYKAKAEYLLDPVRNESIRNILKSRAASIKANSDAKHKRQAAAAQQREPGAPGMAVSANAKQLKPNGTGTKAFSEFFDKALA